MDKNFLVTAAGGAALTSILPQIEEIGFDNIIFVDMCKDVAVKHLVDNKNTFFYQCPYGKDSKYSKFISNIIREHNISYIIPGAEEELIKILNLKLYAGFSHLKICGCNNFKFTQMCLDKKWIMDDLHYAGFTVPRTIDICNFNKKIDSLIVAKPRIDGHGSKGLIIRTIKEIKKYLRSGLIDFNKYLLQEKINGPEYTVSVLSNGLIVPKKIIKKQGVTISAVTEYNKQIIGQCRDLITVYLLNNEFNVLNVQGIIDERDNKFKIFEINPRLSSSTCLSYAAGVNEVSFGLGLSNSEWIKYDDIESKFKNRIVMNRFYNQLFNNNGSVFQSDNGLIP